MDRNFSNFCIQEKIEGDCVIFLLLAENDFDRSLFFVSSEVR